MAQPTNKRLVTEAAAATTSTADRARANHTGTQLAATISDLTEAVQDVVGAALVAGTGATVTYNDTAGTVTIATTTDPEVVRDAIGTALVAGAGITVTVNDAGDTITIASSALLKATQPTYRRRTTANEAAPTAANWPAREAGGLFDIPIGALPAPTDMVAGDIHWIIA